MKSLLQTPCEINYIFFRNITGDDKNQVHMEGYQVSNQCMALVRDGCLVPTKDAPELGYVIESTDKQYVPDVFYKVSSNISILFSIRLRFLESLQANNTCISNECLQIFTYVYRSLIFIGIYAILSHNLRYKYRIRTNYNT